ncbi:MAG: acyl-CoA dehydrogenase family protein [Microthrixaceae bacterium]
MGRYVATHQAMGLMNLRSASRAVAGAGPGPEGAMTKLILSELGHESAAMLAQLNGLDTVYIDGMGAINHILFMMHRGMSIMAGLLKIKRDQIGERILGLPRDPLIK